MFVPAPVHEVFTPRRGAIAIRAISAGELAVGQQLPISRYFVGAGFEEKNDKSRDDHGISVS